MEQSCIKNEKSYCKAKQVPVKLKTENSKFDDIHTFTISQNTEKLNIDFIKLIDTTGKVKNIFYILNILTYTIKTRFWNENYIFLN